DHAVGLGAGQLERLFKHLVRDGATQRLQHLELVLVGQTGVGEFGIVEIAAGSRIGAVEQLTVGPFEIEEQTQGLAYSAVSQVRASNVEDEALHAGRIVIVDVFADRKGVVE